MAKASEKSLPLAIGLNLLLPGLGYVYMGRAILGLAALGLSVLLVVYSGALFFIPTWVVLNLIMAIDMVILFNKNRAAVVALSTKKCPQCAELIQKDAKICRFCRSNVSESVPNAGV